MAFHASLALAWVGPGSSTAGPGSRCGPSLPGPSGCLVVLRVSATEAACALASRVYGSGARRQTLVIIQCLMTSFLQRQTVEGGPGERWRARAGKPLPPSPRRWSCRPLQSHVDMQADSSQPRRHLSVRRLRESVRWRSLRRPFVKQGLRSGNTSCRRPAPRLPFSCPPCPGSSQSLHRVSQSPGPARRPAGFVSTLTVAGTRLPAVRVELAVFRKGVCVCWGGGAQGGHHPRAAGLWAQPRGRAVPPCSVSDLGTSRLEVFLSRRGDVGGVSRCMFFFLNR